PEDATDSPTSSDADDTSDAGADAPAAACSEAGRPCTLAGTRALCNGALTCAPCNDPTADASANDDTACTSAYGGTQLCIGGVCTPGNCRVPIDCIYGYGVNYCGHDYCGSCVSDTQCPGVSPFCDYLLPEGGLGGHCVAKAGLTACGDAGDDTPCPANPGDVCCGGVCVEGSCCSADGGSAFCRATQGAASSCVSNQCTTCPAPTGTDYYVDPVNGDDALGTGSIAPGEGGPSTGCAFKTVTRALDVIPLTAVAGTRIILLGPTTFGAAETMPIRLRAHIVLATQGGAVELDFPRSTFQSNMIVLLGPGAGLQGSAAAPLTLAGLSSYDFISFPDWGVESVKGTDDTTFVENVTLENFGVSGVFVAAGGVLTIRQGVVSTGAQQIGLEVAGRATVSVAAGEVPSSFSFNSIYNTFIGAPRVAGAGISVAGAGSIAVHGVPGSTPDTGTIVANGNANSGLTLSGSGTSSPSPSVIDGLVSYGNGPSSFIPALDPSGGVVLYGGSNVRMRNSVSLGNVFSGVVVIPLPATTPDAGANDDVSRIDLGTTALLDGGGVDWGHNVLQAADGGANGQAGLCLGLDPGSGALAAAGNVFSGVDCSGASPGAIAASRGQCGAGVDVGFGTYLPDAGAYEAGPGYAGNDVNVANCTK
ncbi:MAG: hypothetical protein ACRENE_32515, partial [Polyangiaceae bacterium]